MSVASTKAFYAQIAAGFLLARAIAEEVGGSVDPACSPLCATCRRRMHETVRPGGNRSVRRRGSLAPSKRYWAIVGNGNNRIAAEELRIKLSELCYKSIACDAHRGQEAHRPVLEPLVLVCAAGLTGSTADDVAKEVAIYRAAQGVAPGDRDRRRGPLLRRARRPSPFPTRTRSSASCSRRWPVTCSATRRRSPSMRRHFRCARRVRRSSRRWGDVALDATGRHRCCGGCARSFERRPAGSSTDCEGVATTATSRRARRCGWPRRSATRRDSALDALPGRARASRNARRGGRRPDCRRSPGHRGAHPPGRRHQAPGQDRHRRHLAHRRDAAAGADLVAGRARGWRARDRLSYRTLRTLADIDPAIAEVTGWIRYRDRGRRGGRRGACLDRRSTGAASPATCQPHRVERPDFCGAPSTGWPTERAGARRAGPWRRPHDRDRAGDEGRPGDRDHPAPRAIRRAAARVSAARGALQGYRNRYVGAARRWCSRPSPPSATTSWPTVPADDLLTEPITCPGRPLAHCRLTRAVQRRSRQAEERKRRPAWPGNANMIGIGVDLCEVDRMRAALARTPRLRGPASSPRPSRQYCDRRRDPTERYAARFAAKEAVMKAMGVGLGACRLREIEVARASSGEPSVRLHGGAARLAEERGITDWRLTISRTAASQKRSLSPVEVGFEPEVARRADAARLRRVQRLRRAGRRVLRVRGALVGSLMTRCCPS